ncbi:Dabb family protein [Actinomarinicola tropica]|uniref:Dabb family protein n=1 Tax=Actinomarinicola tropica TaxID=2789776 RepID=UPI00189BEFBF|nr:Dabb family protein [Actinomarinicola tropica]
MIRHCVLLRIAEGTDPEVVERIVEALRTLPARIPSIRTYEVGVDLGWRDGNAEIGIVAGFDDQEGWRAYVDHPDHVAVIEQHIAPVVTSRQAVQFQV